MNWLARFWYHDTIEEMQRKMLGHIYSNRPSAHNFVRRSQEGWRKHFAATELVRHNTSYSWYHGYEMYDPGK